MTPHPSPSAAKASDTPPGLQAKRGGQGEELGVLPLCLFAAASDALLIWTGVIGFGVLAQIAPGFARLMTWGGAVFLFTYGALRFRAAYRGDYRLELREGRERLKKTLLTLAGFTFLNPHVYLDTIGLIGAVSA